MHLSSEHRPEVVSAMRMVREHGTRAARHLRGDIFEVRAVIDQVGYRVLFAQEGRRSKILLSLQAYRKRGRRHRITRSTWPSDASGTGAAGLGANI